MAFRVRTQAFEGPFDLLLHLVSKHEVDIGAISIADVCDQYLAEIEDVETLDLDVASDFLVVASTLLAIKANSLLPADSDEDDEEDGQLDYLTPDQARDILVDRLIAYRQHRSAAAALLARAEAESRMAPRTAGPDPEFLDIQPDFLEGITLHGLAVICADLDARRQTMLLEAEYVAPRRVPLALHMTSVDRLVRSRGTTTFADLLDEEPSAPNVVVTALSVLELYKRAILDMEQEEVFGPIDIRAVEGAESFSPGTTVDEYEGGATDD